MEEIKQAISKLPSEPPTVAPELGKVASQLPISELPSEISVSPSSQSPSELPVRPESELLSELPGRSHALDATLTDPLVSDDTSATSEPLSQLPGRSHALDATLTDPLVSDDTSASINELPGESPVGTLDDDAALTGATVSNDASAPNSKEVISQISLPLTGTALARRLGVAPASISRNKIKDNFAVWTSLHDPDGIAWHFDGQTFQRVPSSPPP